MLDNDVSPEATVVQTSLPTYRADDLAQLVWSDIFAVNGLVLLQVVLARESLPTHRT